MFISFHAECFLVQYYIHKLLICIYMQVSYGTKSLASSLYRDWKIFAASHHQLCSEWGGDRHGWRGCLDIPHILEETTKKNIIKLKKKKKKLSFFKVTFLLHLFLLWSDFWLTLRIRECLKRNLKAIFNLKRLTVRNTPLSLSPCDVQYR